jgi:pimeloyl-ACP methyl ester carboxylesterase
MKQVMGSGVAIQLAGWGEQGKPVLCVHGLTANCRCWDGIAEALSAKHHILAMDLRGRGRSERPVSGYDIGHHCLDIEALLHDLGLHSAVLMGHSLGAFITLAFAAHYPQSVERIILVDGGGQLSPEQFAKVIGGVKPAIERLGKVFPSLEAYCANLKQAPFLQPWSPALETYLRYEVEEVPAGIRSRVQPSAIEEELRNLRQFNVAELYPLVRCPVLILRAENGTLAEDDILLPDEVLERMLREIPDARCVNVKDTNHYTIMFQPHAVRDQAIIEFLEEG